MSKIPAPSYGPAIQVGVSKDTVAELRAAIMDILSCDAGDAVRIEALTTLRDGCAVTNTSISNCQIETGRPS